MAGLWALGYLTAEWGFVVCSQVCLLTSMQSPNALQSLGLHAQKWCKSRDLTLMACASACPVEPPGTDRDASGGWQSHPPRERGAGQRS